MVRDGFREKHAKNPDNTALSLRTPNMRRVVYWENTALSSCGGDVRRVQYYPCECSKKCELLTPLCHLVRPTCLTRIWINTLVDEEKPGFHYKKCLKLNEYDHVFTKSTKFY